VAQKAKRGAWQLPALIETLRMRSKSRLSGGISPISPYSSRAASELLKADICITNHIEILRSREPNGIES
jgi:hypothetical protein